MGFALSLVPLLVAGQFGTLRLTISDATDVSINAANCGGQLAGNVQTTINAIGICSALQLWVTRNECGEAPVSGNDYVLPEIDQQTLTVNRNQNQPVPITVDRLPYFAQATADGGAGCGGTGVEITQKFCAAVSVASDAFCSFGKTTLKAQTPVSIRYDTLAPLPPTISSVEPFDGAAAVTVSASDSDTASVTVQLRAQGVGDFVDVLTRVAPGSKTVHNLENGKTYEVRAIAYDAVMPAPNESEPSAPVAVTPRASSGFWDACREAGCNNGCSAAAAGPLGLAALLLMMMVSWRKRR
jgi:hypothetical protein